MKKLMSLILLVALIIMPLSLTGCSSSQNNSKPPETTTPAVTQQPANTTAPANTQQPAAAKKTFAVVAGDAIGDRGFTDMANQGIVKAAKDFGVEYKVFECHNDPTTYLDTLKAAASKYDVILVVPGYFFDKELETVHGLYPDKTFVYFDGVSALKGLKSVQFSQNEGAFLAGVLAAKLTTDTSVKMINSDKKVGFVGGADMPVIRDYQTGFEQGVKYADPTVEVIAKYAGTHYDPAKGKTTAFDVNKSGADVIFQAAGPTGLGVLEAAKAYNFIAIGVDTDQGYLQPGFIVSSMLKRVDTAVYNVVKNICEGKQLADVSTYNVANEGINLANNDEYNKTVPDSIRKAVDEAAKKIISGEIKVANYK